MTFGNGTVRSRKSMTWHSFGTTQYADKAQLLSVLVILGRGTAPCSCLSPLPVELPCVHCFPWVCWPRSGGHTTYPTDRSESQGTVLQRVSAFCDCQLVGWRHDENELFLPKQGVYTLAISTVRDLPSHL